MTGNRIAPARVYGYIRVSSKDQNVDRQLKELLDLGIPEQFILIDKQSGKDFNRPNYQLLKQILREGDLLYIKSIDRFGRNSKEIKREWEELTQVMKVDIKVIDMPLLDTTLHKDLLGTFVSDLVLQVLSFMAEQERENIKKRQSEGIAVAKLKGKHLGRPQFTLKSLSKEQHQLLKDNYNQWKDKEITATLLMNKLELKRNTFYKIVKEYEEQLQKR